MRRPDHARQGRCGTLPPAPPARAALRAGAAVRVPACPARCPRLGQRRSPGRRGSSVPQASHRSRGAGGRPRRDAPRPGPSHRAALRADRPGRAWCRFRVTRRAILRTIAPDRARQSLPTAWPPRMLQQRQPTRSALRRASTNRPNRAAGRAQFQSGPTTRADPQDHPTWPAAPRHRGAAPALAHGADHEARDRGGGHCRASPPGYPLRPPADAPTRPAGVLARPAWQSPRRATTEHGRARFGAKARLRCHRQRYPSGAGEQPPGPPARDLG